MSLKVGFIGLGKLGMPCAETMATVYDITGYDIYKRESPVIDIVDSMDKAVTGQDIIFIAIQTPHEEEYDGSTPTSHLPNKDFQYDRVEACLSLVNEHVENNALVVLISTVLPGTIRKTLAPLITNGRFIYNPYLIAMGSVGWDMVNPEMIIIGTEDGSKTSEAKILDDFYFPLMENHPRIEIGTWEEAESIKIFYNTFISAKLGIVNMIQDVGMKIGHMNVDVVTNALANSTKRIISSQYMKAGMGDGGPCHPRDNIALRYMADELGLGYDLFDAIMRAREQQAKNVATFLGDLSREHYMPVVILGKAYKPGVPYTDGSYSILIGHYLDSYDEDGIHYYYADPQVESIDFDDWYDPEYGVRCIAFLAHDRKVTYGYMGGRQEQELYVNLRSKSIVVDPWRNFTTDRDDITVIPYGNTRS